jgi:hypothetical protein
MHEPSELNDPLAEKLGRLTPDTTGLDRDALLFQAGRASAHPRRVWPALAGLLAMSQAATLLFFLTRPPEPARTVVVAPAPETPALREESDRPASDEPREWTYRRAIQSGNIDDLPKQPPIENAVAASEVLTVRSVSAMLAVE